MFVGCGGDSNPLDTNASTVGQKELAQVPQEAQAKIENYLVQAVDNQVDYKIEEMKVVDEGIYLVRYNLNYFDARMRLDLFKVTAEKLTMLHRIQNEKEGEGGLKYSNLKIDKDAKTLSYTSWDSHEPETKTDVVFNYETAALTRTPLTH